MIVVDSFLQVPLDGADKYLVTSSIARAPNRSRRYPRIIPGVARCSANFCSGGARSIPGPAGRGLRCGETLRWSPSRSLLGRGETPTKMGSTSCEPEGGRETRTLDEGPPSSNRGCEAAASCSLYRLGRLRGC